MEELQKKLQEIKDDIEEIRSLNESYEKYINVFSYLDKIDKEIK